MSTGVPFPSVVPRRCPNSASAWLLALACCGFGAVASANDAAKVDQATIVANARTGRDWPSHGLDYAETRFSRLKQIDTNNVKKLGLAWTYDLKSTHGVEATPIVVDGVMYVSAPWSIVHAVDVRTGKRNWTYDPEVPRRDAYKGCCDVVNRGVAVYRGKLIVATFDGRLVAINAATGKKVWEQDTIIDHSRAYTVTAAPRVFKGNVVIGNGGAEYGVRGYVSAYDAETGAMKWRWFIVPGDPSKPFEDESMARAALTWDPSGKYWENGGGGTAWHSMVFDPQLNLMYIGTGNGGPWAWSKRSPGGGDNLYLASIVALDPDTGKYVWHYQETPGDSWDYTSAQDLILADIKIDGKLRKVILHAPKNGFFFVVDRSNGKFISAKNFVDVNWATGYDANGRPIVNTSPQARSPDQPFDAIPGPMGGHNWHSMSYSPLTGLAYIPAQHIPTVLATDQTWTGQGSNKPGQPMSGSGWNLAMQINSRPPQSKPFGRLVAWDPLRQQQVWSQEYASPWNGGTLVTAGNLVFQGTADGRFIAYHAKTGKKLWETPLATGIVAAPVSYEVDGKQYLSIAAGWGGAYAQGTRATEQNLPSTVYTFVLGGNAKLPTFAKHPLAPLVSGVSYDPKDVPEGKALYVSNCVACHGIPGANRGGSVPNLGYMNQAVIANLGEFLFDGPSVSNGMPDYTGKLSAAEAEKIKAFIQDTANAFSVRTSPTYGK